MAMAEDSSAGHDGFLPRPRRKRRHWPAPLRRLRRAGKRLIRSPAVTSLAGRLVYRALVLAHSAQRPAAGSSDWERVLADRHPAIVGLWHGQHLLAPFFRPRTLPYVALLSRNADAEVNAAVVERFGIGTVRGSGGRDRLASSEKGGVRALITLRRMLAAGSGVCMIADVAKATPREAGLGIVTLAKISGRPIVPAAAVTSRRHVVKSSWDRTTIPLPFGRLAVVLGDPIEVPADADAALLEEKRLEVTRAIERANQRAEALADGAR